MGNAFVLHLIRHAPTAGNRRKAYIGWTDEPVLPFKAGADPNKQAVFGSDLLRCRQTAQVLFPDACYFMDAGFREIHFGDWENRTYEDLRLDKHYRQWIDDPFKVVPPGGESFQQFAKRIDAAIESFPPTGEFTVITHGGPIRYILSKAKGAPFNSQSARHGSCYTVEWEDRSAYEEGKRCTSFSEVPLMGSANT